MREATRASAPRCIRCRPSIVVQVRRWSMRVPGAMRHMSLRTVTVSAALIWSPLRSTMLTMEATRTVKVAMAYRPPGASRGWSWGSVAT